MDVTALFLIGIVGGYTIGALSTGYLIGMIRGSHFWKQGSRSAGATNVARALGWRWGIVAALGDASKGLLATFLISHYVPIPWFAVTVLMALATGNILSWWFLRLRGGKGFAVLAGGSLFIVSYPYFVLFIGLWVFLLCTTRRMSLTNLIAAGSLPLFVGALSVWMFGVHYPIEHKVTALFAAAAIVFSHRENIWRLWKGKEPPLTLKW